MPLGIWLIQSAAAPRTQEMRVAATGLLVFITSTLLYIGVGFAFMFGNIGNLIGAPELNQYTSALVLPVPDQTWAFLGLHGFLLSDSTNVRIYQLILSFLPLAITSSLVVSSLLGVRTKLVIHLVMTAFVSAVVFPIIGNWIYSGGWLSALGLNLNLGHGAVDMGGLASAVLAAGGTGLAWLLVIARREARPAPELPATHFPFRAVSGVILLIAGTAAFVGGNPLYPSAVAGAVDVLALNCLLACSIAVIASLGYSLFASHSFDVLLAARAALAAVIAISVGAILLPAWTAIVTGLFAAVMATLGYYYINEVARLQDDAGIISLVIIPALMGYLMTGLFASGAFTAGWNGVGATDYLGVANLGITGALPGATAVGDPGQLTAEIVVSGIVFAFAFIAALPVAYAMRSLAAVESLPQPRQTTKRTVAVRRQPHVGAAAVSPMTAASNNSGISAASVTAAIDLPVSAMEPPTSPIPVEMNGSPNVRIEQVMSVADTVPATQQAQPGWLDKLRALRYREKKPDTPVQARHVAYPTRAGGRRIMVRPVVKPSNDTPATAESSKPAP